MIRSVLTRDQYFLSFNTLLSGAHIYKFLSLSFIFNEMDIPTIQPSSILSHRLLSRVGKFANFRTMRDGETSRNFDYDYNSIMHYGPYFFR